MITYCVEQGPWPILENGYCNRTAAGESRSEGFRCLRRKGVLPERFFQVSNVSPAALLWTPDSACCRIWPLRSVSPRGRTISAGVEEPRLPGAACPWGCREHYKDLLVRHMVDLLAVTSRVRDLRPRCSSPIRPSWRNSARTPRAERRPAQACPLGRLRRGACPPS